MNGIGVKLRILKKRLPIFLIFLAVRWSRCELLHASPYIRPPCSYILFRCTPDHDTPNSSVHKVRAPTGEKRMKFAIFT